MDTVIGVMLWAAIIAGIARWRSARRRAQARTGSGGIARPVARDPAARRQETNPIPGWIAGHYIAHGRTGFPGDPLPHGHLGSPANLAFWGGMFDEDDDAEDDE